MQCLAEKIKRPTNFEQITPDNVEDEIVNLNLIENDYVSDDDGKVR